MGDSPVCVPHIDAQYNVKKCKWNAFKQVAGETGFKISVLFVLLILYAKWNYFKLVSDESINKA